MVSDYFYCLIEYKYNSLFISSNFIYRLLQRWNLDPFSLNFKNNLENIIIFKMNNLYIKYSKRSITN